MTTLLIVLAVVNGAVAALAVARYLTRRAGMTAARGDSERRDVVGLFGPFGQPRGVGGNSVDNSTEDECGAEETTRATPRGTA